QRDHPQHPLGREGVELEEDKLLRAIGLGTPDRANNDGHGSALRGYPGLLTLLYAFTEQNSINDIKLEDAVQLTVGNDAFMLFSYDKVMNCFLRQLKVVMDDQLSLKMLQLFRHQAGLGQSSPTRYLSECSRVVKGRSSNLFRLQWSEASEGPEGCCSLLMELIVPNNNSGSGSGSVSPHSYTAEPARSASPATETASLVGEPDNVSATGAEISSSTAALLTAAASAAAAAAGGGGSSSSASSPRNGASAAAGAGAGGAAAAVIGAARSASTSPRRGASPTPSANGSASGSGSGGSKPTTPIRAAAAAAAAAAVTGFAGKAEQAL
ncbi:unnamed protein product, partial [Laminaria digitata]